MSKNKKSEIIGAKSVKIASLTLEEKKVFNRISEKFRQYWACLLKLIFFYIVAYLVWKVAISSLITPGKGWQTYLTLALIQGGLFSVDGFVTSLLKSPFNQMCYAINKSNLIADNIKDYVITKATESNEHCKETMKKFGIIAITSELAKTFIEDEESNKEGHFWKPLSYLSYFIPLLFAYHSIWIIRKELKKIRNIIKNSAEVVEVQKNV